MNKSSLSKTRCVFTLSFAVLVTCASLDSARAAVRHDATATELHWLICEPSSAAVLRKLDQTNPSSNRRAVSYFDTSTQSLFAAGVVLRNRDKSDGSFQSTAKVVISQLSEIDASWFDEKNFKCESDRHGLSTRLNCSLSRKGDAGEELFSPKQLRLVRELSGLELDIDALQQYGPVQESTFNDLQIETKLGPIVISLESDALSSRPPVLEISTRVESGSVDKTATEVSLVLKNSGLKLCETQTSKTRQLLEALAN